MLRPRHQFPTPAFRVVVGGATGFVGAAPAWTLLGPNGWIALPLATAAATIPLVAWYGSTAQRLKVAAGTAFGLLIVVDAITFTIALVTYPWE